MACVSGAGPAHGGGAKSRGGPWRVAPPPATYSVARTQRLEHTFFIRQHHRKMASASRPKPSTRQPLARRHPRLALPRPQVRRAVSLPLRTPLLRLHVARLAIDLDRLSTWLSAGLGGRCVCATGTADPRYPQSTHIVLARRVPRPGRRAITQPLVPLHAAVCRPAIRAGSCPCS
jgi:hypothetical protein